MNRYHQRRCQSPEWAACLAGSVLPAVLDGIDLGSRVLELGPGYGASTRPLASRAASLTAVEADPALARRLQAELGDRVTVVHGDARELPFGDATFSAVTCFTMLHHLPDRTSQDRLFAESARVLRPGGVLAGADSLPSLRWRLIHLGDTCTPIDPVTLPDRLARAGLHRIQVTASGRRARFVAYAPSPAGNGHD